jgi:flagellar motor switch protein FliN/FliY
MASDLSAVLRLEVPVIVRLGGRSMSLTEVVALVPGSIVQLPKNADDELDLLINNKQIGTGAAVKVGENFGIRINYIGDIRERIAALGGQAAPAPTGA